MGLLDMLGFIWATAVGIASETGHIQHRQIQAPYAKFTAPTGRRDSRLTTTKLTNATARL